jgi:hypothetical protein
MRLGKLSADTASVVSKMPGFFDTAHKNNWYKQLSNVKAYYQTHERLPTVTKTANQEEIKLARWLITCREKIRKGTLAEERVRSFREAGYCEQTQSEYKAEYHTSESARHEPPRLAEATGHTPSPAMAAPPRIIQAPDSSKQERSENSEAATKMFVEFGGWVKMHARFPKEDSTDSLERSLALWHSTICSEMGLGARSEDTAAIVSKKPKPVATAYDEKWNTHLSALKAYYQTHNRFPTPSNAASPEELFLARWRYICIGQIRKGTLAEERVRLFREAGFDEQPQYVLKTENPPAVIPQPETPRVVEVSIPSPPPIRLKHLQRVEPLAMSREELLWYRLFNETVRFKREFKQLPKKTSPSSEERELASWHETNCELIQKGQLDIKKKGLLRAAGLLG